MRPIASCYRNSSFLRFAIFLPKKCTRLKCDIALSCKVYLVLISSNSKKFPGLPVPAFEIKRPISNIVSSFSICFIAPSVLKSAILTVFDIVFIASCMPIASSKFNLLATSTKLNPSAASCLQILLRYR